MAQEANMFSAENELMRIESFEKIDSTMEAPLMAFFRRVGFPHLYSEFLVPAAREGKVLGIIAVKDRAWPPWGSGAHTVHALALASPVTRESAGLCNVFVLEEDVGNIGLIAAVYKETIATLIRQGVREVSYIVREGSVFARRVLSNTGFKRTEELFLTHGSRYNVYSAEPSAHLAAMGLHKTEVPDLLDGNLEDQAFSAVSQWVAATTLGSLSFWSERSELPEIIPNTGGFLHASRPGGTSIRREDEVERAGA